MAIQQIPGAKALAEFAEQGSKASNGIPQELKTIIEVIAITGEVWHDWQDLKVLVAAAMGEVLMEYEKARTSSVEVGPPKPLSSGETFSQLSGRLIRLLDAFVDGPPFTIQRLCEILLDPWSTYRILDKVAFAMEKVLLVNSTLDLSSSPYPMGNFVINSASPLHIPPKDLAHSQEEAVPMNIDPEKESGSEVQESSVMEPDDTTCVPVPATPDIVPSSSIEEDTKHLDEGLLQKGENVLSEKEDNERGKATEMEEFVDVPLSDPPSGNNEVHLTSELMEPQGTDEGAMGEGKEVEGREVTPQETKLEVMEDVQQVEQPNKVSLQEVDIKEDNKKGGFGDALDAL